MSEHPEQQSNDGNLPPDNPEAPGSGWIAGDAQDELTGHLYDGIQEYDNPLPGWWKWLFVVTILFSFPYYAYYHFGATGRSVEDQFMAANAENARKRVAELGEIRPDRETLVRFVKKDTSGLEVGRITYLANCVACHGINGGGIVGPNLTDDHYKNVREIEDILNIINNGAAGGAMPAWLNRLPEPDRVLVSAYVASLRGTDPGAGARPREGDEIAPWPEYEEVATASSEEDETAGGADAGEDSPAPDGGPAAEGEGQEAEPTPPAAEPDGEVAGNESQPPPGAGSSG